MLLSFHPRARFHLRTSLLCGAVVLLAQPLAIGPAWAEDPAQPYPDVTTFLRVPEGVETPDALVQAVADVPAPAPQAATEFDSQGAREAEALAVAPERAVTNLNRSPRNQEAEAVVEVAAMADAVADAVDALETVMPITAVLSTPLSSEPPSAQPVLSEAPVNPAPATAPSETPVEQPVFEAPVSAAAPAVAEAPALAEAIPAPPSVEVPVFAPPSPPVMANNTEKMSVESAAPVMDKLVLTAPTKPVVETTAVPPKKAPAAKPVENEHSDAEFLKHLAGGEAQMAMPVTNGPAVPAFADPVAIRESVALALQNNLGSSSNLVGKFC